jgi:poly(U)-specific endoribonuclease
MFVLLCLGLLASYAVANPTPRATDAEIRAISSDIWAADANRISGSDVQYQTTGSQLYTYVNEARFTGTYAKMLALRDNFTPDVTVAESCGQACVDEENAFLDAIIVTEPIQLLHQWLIGQGLASSSVSEFKNELFQYWFMKYTRGGGPLGSSGFEHVFVGEIKNNAVSGSHNWVNFYLEEKDGDFNYGTFQNQCTPEIMKFSSKWLGYTKAVTSCFMRTSPEVEIALFTLCLLTRIGGSCPVTLGGTQLTLTVWDMTGIPKTIGSAYPNC